MYNRLIVFGLVLTMGMVFVPLLVAENTDGGCAFLGLTEFQTVIDLHGRERVQVEVARPVKEELKANPPIATEPGSMERAENLVAESRLTIRFKTPLLPVTVPLAFLGNQPVFTPEALIVNDVETGAPVDVNIGDDKTPEELAAFLEAQGWEEISLADPDDSSIMLKALKRLSDGKVVAFRNCRFVVRYQKEPSLLDGDDTTPGKQFLDKRVSFGAAGFEDAYSLGESDPVNFSVNSDCKIPVFIIPPTVGFDGGGDNAVGAANASNAAPEVLMETFVTLEGEVFTGTEASGLVAATPPTFQAMNGGNGVMGRVYVYVEDEFPPLLDVGNLIPSAVETVGQISEAFQATDQGASEQNSFVIGGVQYYNNDGSGYSQGTDPNRDVTPIWHWPNKAPIDRNNANGDDYKWNEIAMRNDNANDERVSMTFNYEAGLSVYNRVKYVGSDGEYRYVYYIPPKKIVHDDGTSEWIGPYAGKVTPGNTAGTSEADIYEYTPATQAYLENFYKPINFPKFTDPDTGKVMDVKKAVDWIYRAADPEEYVQAENKKSLAENEIYQESGFAKTAAISVKWGRECVQGITIGSSGDADLKIPEGTMLIPSGWASARLSPDSGAGKVRRLESADAQIDHAAVVTSGGDYARTQMGTPADGDDAADAFFKINAADCCSNNVVVASGTYGSEDNMKPSPKLVIEELDVRHGADQALLDVATVPNDLTGAGNPLGAYDPDRVYYRLHDNNVPIYGSGVQGEAVRGYGNFSNNAPVWNGMAEEKTLANPVDGSPTGNPNGFLATRFVAGEPNFQEKRRHKITIMADDNLGPQIDTGSGDVVWPMRHVSYKFYHHPTDPNAQVATEFTGGQLEELQNEVTSAMAGWDLMLEGTVVAVAPDVDAGDDAAWSREPLQEFEYNFPRSGRWVIRVDSCDRSENARIMLVKVDVGSVNLDMRSIQLNSTKSD